MKHFNVQFNEDWKVLGGSERSQAAVMVISRGDAEGGPNNKHEGSDQWLYVVSGQGRAIVNQKEIKLGPGSLLLVEAGEKHQIINDNEEPLATLNFYAPPTYDE